MNNIVSQVEQMFSEITYVNSENELYYLLSDLERDELVTSFIEIEPVDTDSFLKIKETLTRIGIANRTTKTLYQSCMILQKKDKYYICHFKEMFAMDGKQTKMQIDDYTRRNHIAKLLEQWNLIKIINKDVMEVPSKEEMINVYVLPYKEKSNWKLEAKYMIGTVPTKENNYEQKRSRKNS